MQLCTLLTIVLILAQPEPPPASVSYTLISVSNLLCQVAVVLAARAFSLQACSRQSLEHLSSSARHRWLDHARTLQWSLWAALSLLGATLFQWTAVAASADMGSALLGGGARLLPALLGWAGTHLCFYHAEQDYGRTTLSACAYLYWNFRAALALPLLAIGLVLAHADVLRFWPASGGGATSVLLQGLPILILLPALPWLMQRMWRTTPLVDGPLRRQLMSQADQVGFPLSDVRRWDTQGQMLNAAYCSPSPWHRFVLLTDRMLEELPRRALAFVLLHEIAHARLRHSFTLIVHCVVILSTTLLIARSAPFAGLPGFVAVAVVVSFLIVGWRARLCELEADQWARNQLLDLPDVWEEALRSVAAGQRRGWLHPSYAERCAMLRWSPQRAGVRIRQEKNRITVLLTALVLLGAVAGLTAA